MSTTAVPLPTPDEFKTLPAYTMADAARYIGTTPGTLRRWFRGRPMKVSSDGGLRGFAVPPILPTEAGPREPLSFIDLIEAHVLFSIRKGYNFPIKRVKAAMEYLAGQLGGNLLFLAHKDFLHDHRDLFLGTDSQLLSLSERGQIVDKTIMSNGLRQLKYGKDGFADEFFPKIGNVVQTQLVVNPLINHGQIYIARLGVSANAIAERFNAGEKMVDLETDYGATAEEIVEAIRWHDRLAA